MKKGEVFGILTIVGIVALIALVMMIATNNFTPIQSILPSKCSVGIAGANATVTFSGVGAETQCNKIVTNPNNQVSWYELQGVQPSGNVMCEGTLQGYTIIVRDQGIFNLYGNDICSNFLREGMTPTS